MVFISDLDGRITELEKLLWRLFSLSEDFIRANDAVREFIRHILFHLG